jgi:hypothetical protein
VRIEDLRQRPDVVAVEPRPELVGTTVPQQREAATGVAASGTVFGGIVMLPVAKPPTPVPFRPTPNTT